MTQIEIDTMEVVEAIYSIIVHSINLVADKIAPAKENQERSLI